MEQGCYLSSVVVPLLICLRWLFGNLFLPRHYNKAFINFYLLETVKRTMLEGRHFDLNFLNKVPYVRFYKPRLVHLIFEEHLYVFKEVFPEY